MSSFSSSLTDDSGVEETYSEESDELLRAIYEKGDRVELPALDDIVPGQSVSTLFKELFADFEDFEAQFPDEYGY